MEHAPRPANSDELNQLLGHCLDQLNEGPHAAQDIIAEQTGFVNRACVAVFDNYRSDGPGYSGKVMVVVWEGAPEMVQSYIWSNGQIELLGR